METRREGGDAAVNITQRLRRAWRAFRDYPGRRVTDGGEAGTLVVCGEPYGCGGSGVLHEPDVPPPVVQPQDSKPW